MTDGIGFVNINFTDVTVLPNSDDNGNCAQAQKYKKRYKRSTTDQSASVFLGDGEATYATFEPNSYAGWVLKKHAPLFNVIQEIKKLVMLILIPQVQVLRAGPIFGN